MVFGGSGVSMRVPDRKYTKDQFKNYLTSNIDQLYKQDERKQWLAIYSFLVNDDKWPYKIFEQKEIKNMGEIIEVSPKVKKKEDQEIYYLLEYDQGLWLMYTTASKKQYSADLSDRIKGRKGITRMWLKPSLFRIYWKNILEESGGYVYNFRANRREYSDKPSKLRPNFKRRVNYTGKDAENVIDEMEEQYGVVADIIKIQAERGFKIYITNDGLFSVQTPSKKALALFYNNLELVRESVVNIWTTSNEMKFDFVTGKWGQQLTSVKPGRIGITASLDKTGIDNLRNRLQDFSFLNDFMEIGSFGYCATVIDENKGSVFHITANSEQILIVPKFKYTFESFIDFYRGVVEVVDEEASFQPLYG